MMIHSHVGGLSMTCCFSSPHVGSAQCQSPLECWAEFVVCVCVFCQKGGDSREINTTLRLMGVRTLRNVIFMVKMKMVNKLILSLLYSPWSDVKGICSLAHLDTIGVAHVERVGPEVGYGDGLCLLRKNGYNTPMQTDHSDTNPELSHSLVVFNAENGVIRGRQWLSSGGWR